MTTITDEYRANTEHFYITLHPATFLTRESFNLARITKDFQLGIADSTRHSIEEILKFSSEGRCYIPSFIENDEEQYHFVSSQLMFIDVDDDEQVTDPQEVLNRLKDICAGLYFTGSHGIKGNRYRLCFIFDKAVRSQAQYRDIFNQLMRRLISIGIPADTNVQDGLQRIRTATNGYILGNPKARLEIDEYLLAAQEQREKEFEARTQKIIEFANKKDYRIYSFEELKERAKCIGYVDEYKDWERLAYSLKAYATDGHIDDADAYEVFSILCGGNDETVYWENLKPRGISIGTFIHASNEAGFKNSFRYYHAVSERNNSKIPVEIKKFDVHISKEFAAEVLEEESAILINSGTGTGKTSNFIGAAKELASTKDKPSRYYLFSVPTIAVVDQVSRDNKVLGIYGESGNIFKQIKAYSDAGHRVIISTYDMTATIVDVLKRINPFSSFSLIIDEYHQFVHSFKFRRKAIESLYSLKNIAKGFIGLSGTTEDVLKSDFNKEIKVETKSMSSPCRIFGAITYKRKIEEETALIQLLKQKAQSGKRLLVFVQNIKMIQRVYQLLYKAGIKVKTITSDGKKNNRTYLHIVEKSTFPEDTQVILTTSVLSDGVNINNDTIKYETIIVCSDDSPLFNVSMVRQCSNRFRNPYEACILFMLEAQKQTKFLFNIDQAHEYNKQLAENVVNLLKNEFGDYESYKLFRPAVLEKAVGISFIRNGEPTYNELWIRYNSFEEKSGRKRFYATFRNQFLIACEKLIGVTASPPINFSEYIETQGVDITAIQNDLNAITEAITENKEAIKSDLEINFTPIVHKAFRENNDAVIQEFKRVSTIEHFTCLKEISLFADYPTALKIAKKVQRAADTHSFKRRTMALLDIFYFDKINRNTATKKVFKELAKYINKPFTSDELKEIVDKIDKGPKKVSKKTNVNTILNTYFTKEQQRTNKERYTILQILCREWIEKEFDMHPTELDKILHKFIQNEESIKQVILQKIFEKAN